MPQQHAAIRLDTHVLRNGLYNAIGAAIQIAVGILAVPLLVRFLGLSEYGLWILVSSALSIMELAELGLSVSTTYFVAGHLSSRNFDGVRVSLTVILGTILVIATTIAVTIWNSSSFILSFFPTLTPMQSATANQAMQIGALVVWARMMQRVFIGIQQAYRKFGLLNAFTSVQVIAISGGSVLIAFAGGATVALMYWNLITSLLSLLAFAFVSVILLRPEIRLAPLWNKIQAVEILKYSLSTWLVSLSTAVFSRADRLIVGAILGTSMLGIYGAITAVTAKINSMSAMVIQPLLPELSTRIARRTEAQTDLLTPARQSLQLNAVTALALAASLYLLAPMVVDLILPTAPRENTIFAFALATVIYGLYSLNAVGYFTHLGLKRMKELLVIQILGAGLSIIAIAIGAYVYGVLGAIVGNAAYLVIFLLTYLGMRHLNVAFGVWTTWIAFPLIWYFVALLAGLAMPVNATGARILVLVIAFAILGRWILAANQLRIVPMIRRYRTG